MEYTLKFGLTRVGPLSLELVETIEGKTIFRWEKLGIKTLQVNKMDNPEEAWAYMDTQGLVGCILEMLGFQRYQ